MLAIVLREVLPLPRRLLVLGGGQLGRMMAEAAAPLGIDVTVLDPAETPPAAAVAAHIRASFTDASAITAAADGHDAVTIEIEHVSVDALEALERTGKIVAPQARVIRVIQDKLLQKRTLSDGGIPVAPEVSSPAGGAVWKARFGGYDGYGVRNVAPGDNLSDLPKSGYFEKKLDVATELAVLVARNRRGETTLYEPLQMVVDGERNVLRSVVWPAAVPEAIKATASDIARSTVDLIDGIGLYAIEMFVTADDEVVVNEIAPRPHNSGHLTIEAAQTSQFEQHLRALFDLPFGPAGRIVPAALMMNILGGDTPGTARLPRYREILTQPAAHLHWYGKRISRPGRKMGHITLTGETPASLEETATRFSDLTAEGDDE